MRSDEGDRDRRANERRAEGGDERQWKKRGQEGKGGRGREGGKSRPTVIL